MRWSLLPLTNQPSPSIACDSLNDLNTAIFPHILTISPLLTVLQNIFYASHNQNISKICNWMALDHSVFCPHDLQMLLRICFHVCICSVTDLCSCAASVLNSIYCNKAAEQYNRPPLKSTNKSLIGMNLKLNNALYSFFVEQQ